VVPLRGAAIVTAFFLVRFVYVRWIGAPEFVYTLGPSAALAKIPETLKLCLIELARPSRWGVLWPAFLVAAVILAARGASREKALAAGTAAALLLMMVPFFFTNWPLALQVEQAYFRLAAQIAPAAAVTLVLAYETARRRIDGARVLR
jgi:hypothetical protein